jgi:predicted MPP superfamily phosphohydrolase
MITRLALFFGMIAFVEFYFYQALKTIAPERFHKIIWILQIIWILLIIGTIILVYFYRPHQWNDVFRIILSMIVIIEFSKLFGSIFMLLDDIRRVILFVLQRFFANNVNVSNNTLTGISRSKFFSQLAMIFTFIPFAGFVYGILRGGYKYKIHQVKLNYPEFPESFSGLKIVQISDLHLGSFFNTKPVEKIVELVMNEKPDIIFFTGDLVNNLANEAIPYVPVLSKLKAPLGVYSILGNHDYGDYVHWDSLEEKQNNLKQLISLQQKMGWDILLNENRILEKNGEKIAIIGVENWGGNLHFPRYGKLDLAYKDTEDIPFKILLSHDPSHWDLEVSQKYKDIQLTLSGHTHGFQFGIESKVLKFSPVQWVYKHWAGLYEKKVDVQLASKDKMLLSKINVQHLYVNRGAGFIGYPGRLGIWPEITVIEISNV